MKKIFYAVLAVVATMFVACKDVQTPEGDLTKLYPAMDASGEAWGYINASGTFVIAPIFDDVTNFSCGAALVEMDDEIKFIDKNGSFLPAPSFDMAEPFYYNYSTIYMDGYCGLMNNKCEMTIHPYFALLGTMGDNGLVLAKRESSSSAKYEYVNAKGETKIPAMYDQAEGFKDGVAVVKLGSKYGAIDKSGKMSIQPIYEYGLWNLSEGLLSYCDKNRKFGILDKNGNSIAAALYYGLSNVSDGLIAYVNKKEKIGYLDTKGNPVLDALYYQAWPFYEGQAWVKQSDDKDARWMSIDKSGQVMFYLGEDEEPETGFHNGLALVHTENGCKYVNTSGALVYSWSYEVDEDEWWAPKQTNENTTLRERMQEFTNMTLHFDSRKL